MSVLHLISDDDRRGAQVFACELADALAANHGQAGRVLALSPGNAGRRLDVPVLGSRPFARSTLAALRREIRASTVVIGHGSTTLPATAIAGIATATPFVYRSIGDPTYWAPPGPRRARTRILLRTADRVAALWPGAADDLEHFFGVPRSKLRVIPNGVDPAPFGPVQPDERGRARARFGVPTEAPVAVYAGALSAEKDVASAVGALATLPGAHLLAAGAGPDLEALRALAARVAPGRVHLVGAIDDPAAALAAGDVLVLPSKTEGMPGVLIEAGLRGLPVVATAVGGVAEIVEHGRTGYVVRPGDPDGLRDAIGAALAEPDGMGARARERCLARFSFDRIAAAWHDLLSELEPATL